MVARTSRPAVLCRVDARAGAPYIPLAMNRILLALLALLTGMMTQVTPAQARMGGGSDTEIGAVETVRGAARPAAAATQAIAAPLARQEKRDREATRVRPARSRIFIPSVLFGPDRALE
ncbi:hypothetical protein GCM10011617_06490 [Novosphingobium arvoryzae]|uniref:Uncharacterized protein n=2 Tax=Novosphingobium arvoryzae TaxID=1256514 RepID=A0A918VD30_9SPHN|nr:hypothetical protein GCM10011617_06490 [Novosphingobium arvoryzae]